MKVAVDCWFIVRFAVFEALHEDGVAVLWWGGFGELDWLAESPAELQKLGVQKR